MITTHQLTHRARMTRVYALQRLLEHGPLCAYELPEITGWPRARCRQTLSWLAETGRIVTSAGKWRLP